MEVGNRLLLAILCCRVIQVPEFNFIWCFENKHFLLESWNIKLNFSTFSDGGCWGQPMSLFWKLVDETQISKPPEPTMNHISIKWLILLPLRDELLFTLQYEIPCSSLRHRLQQMIEQYGIFAKHDLRCAAAICDVRANPFWLKLVMCVPAVHF